ncbi:UNVERIFIED_CONTAM: hypothetical protein HDU68_007416 [Siphonaria sp. JEL0065]|nr:hypothetical protein HDU68_007416 [Siphonaria sp. JEL0065]
MLGSLNTLIFSLIASPPQGKARIRVSYDNETYIIDLESPTIESLKKEMARKLDIDPIQVIIKIDYEGDLCVLASDSMLSEIIVEASGDHKLAKVYAVQKQQQQPAVTSSFMTTVAVDQTARSMVNNTGAKLNPKTVSDLFPEDEFDVMLSYQWDSQSKVLLIRDELKKRYGLNVWMDVDKMRDNIFTSMAEAVDKSKVVAAFVNGKYQASPNCLSELSYARDRKKKIAPARDFHGQEEARGPVYIMTAGALYCNFTDKEPGTHEFDAEIDNLYKNVRLYLDDMERSMKSQQEKPVAKIVEVQEKNGLERWLKPVDFGNDVEAYSKVYVKGTRLWAVDMVNGWLEQDGTDRVLWLNGGAGLGKSIIAWLVSQNLPDSYQLGSAFYCRHNDTSKNNTESLVATLAFNLASAIPALKSHIERVCVVDEKGIEAGNVSILSNPRKAFKKLLIDGFKAIEARPEKNILIIIDALDECGKQGDATRTALLEWIVKDCDLLPPYVKVFVTARPEIDIFDALQSLKSSCLVPSDVLNQADINVFVLDRFTIEFDPKTEQDVALLSSAAESLAQKADGVFIYASLACEELKQRVYALAENNKSHVDFNALLNFVNEYQGGIDDVYTKALTRAFENASRDVISLFRRVIGVILNAQEPLSQDDIANLLDIKTFSVGSMVMQIRPILKISEEGLISVLHKSLADILTSPVRCKDHRFLVATGKVHYELTIACFGILSDLDSSASISSTQVYASQYWSNHLIQSFEQESQSLLTALEKFSKDAIVEWIFSVAQLGKVEAILSGSLESAMMFLSSRFPGDDERVTFLIHEFMEFSGVESLEEPVLSREWKKAVKKLKGDEFEEEIEEAEKEEEDLFSGDNDEEENEEFLAPGAASAAAAAAAPSKMKREEIVSEEKEEFDAEELLGDWGGISLENSAVEEGRLEIAENLAAVNDAPEYEGDTSAPMRPLSSPIKPLPAPGSVAALAPSKMKRSRKQNRPENESQQNVELDEDILLELEDSSLQCSTVEESITFARADTSKFEILSSMDDAPVEAIQDSSSEPQPDSKQQEESQQASTQKQQQEFDERVQDAINVVQHNMESAMHRGEKLEELMQQSNELSMSSENFYKKTKKPSFFERISNLFGSSNSSSVKPPPTAGSASILPAKVSISAESAVVVALASEDESKPSDSLQTPPPMGSTPSLPDLPPPPPPMAGMFEKCRMFSFFNYEAGASPPAQMSQGSALPPPPAAMAEELSDPSPVCFPTRRPMKPIAPPRPLTKVFLSSHPESEDFVSSLTSSFSSVEIVQGSFKEMQDLEFVIVVVSEKYEASKWFRKEASYAVMRKKQIITVLIDGASGDEISGLDARVVDLRESGDAELAVAEIKQFALW